MNPGAPIEVAGISLQVATGDVSHDPHRQGFAAIYATFEVVDSSLIDRLLRTADEKASVTVRCAMLDIVGTISKNERSRNGANFVLAVTDVVYRKLSGPRISVRGKPDRE
jgi:hypothetical protein